MKHQYLSVAACLMVNMALAQSNIGIGTAAPHPSSLLDIQSTNKGLLIPRVTEANLPATPATGLLVYQTNTFNRGFQYYDGSRWQGLGAGISTRPFAIYSEEFGAFQATSSQVNGFAIRAEALANSGTTKGVTGVVSSANGIALEGRSLNLSGGTGVEGFASAGVGVRGITQGLGWGVYALQDVTGSAIGSALYAKTLSASGIAALFESTNPLAHALITGTGRIRFNSLASGQTRLVAVQSNGDLTTMAHVPWETNDNGAHYNPISPVAARIGIGTNSPTSRLHIAHNSVFGGASQLLLEETENDYARMTLRSTANNTRWDMAGLTSTTNANAQLNFFFSGLNADVLSLRGNGNAVVHGTVTANGVLLTSDERLKKDIKPLGVALEKLQNLTPYSYRWKDPAKSNDPQIGLMAQEVEKVFPDLVHTDEVGMKSIAYVQLIPLLLKALQEQQAMLQALQSRIENLENKQ